MVSNANRPGERQRSNFAYELGQLVMDLPKTVHGARDEENWCCQFSGAFLFPTEQVGKAFSESRRRVLRKEYLLEKKNGAFQSMVTPSRAAELLIIGLHSIERILANEDPEEVRPTKVLVSNPNLSHAKDFDSTCCDVTTIQLD